jgi:hypothetical protein
MSPRRFYICALFALLLAPCVAQGQISLAILNGSTQTPVTTAYNFGSYAPNATNDVTFVMNNTGSTPVTVCGFGLSASGPGSAIGFAIVNTSTPPIPIAVGRSFNFFVRFTGGPVGGYTAYLSVNYVLNTATCGSPQSSTPPVQLTGSVVQAAVLTVASPCTGPDAQGNVDFGRIPQTQQVKCTFTLSNPYVEALAITPVSLSGTAFQAALPTQTSIPAGQSLTFQVTFTAAAALPYTGTFSVGPETFPLTGVGYLSPMPAPVLTFNSSQLQSGNQYVLTAALPSAAQTAYNGTITMSFVPSITGTKDDTAVEFVASGSRAVPFSVAQGATALQLGGQSGVSFSSGTTAGTITFTVNAGVIGVNGSATTTATIPAAPVAITASSATDITEALVVSLTGFDNSYSLGPMTFTFFDRSGKPLGSPIQADFSQQFQIFYQNQAPGGVTAGSAFLVAVSFPITGAASTVGSVKIQLNNTAGATTISGLNFP